MTERIPRPPVRLAAGLPDGNLTNIGSAASHLLSDDPLPIYFIGRATRKELKHQDDNDGAEIAVIKVRALEVLHVLPDDARPGMSLEDLMQLVRQLRTGVTALPFPDDKAAEAAAQLRAELADWQAGQDLDDAGLGRVWVAYFEGHQLGEVGSWRDADPVLIREFLAAMRDAADLEDDAAKDAADAKDAAEDDDAIAVQQSETEHAAHVRDEGQALGPDPAGQDDEEPLTAPGPDHPAAQALARAGVPAAEFSENDGRHLTVVADGMTGER